MDVDLHLQLPDGASCANAEEEIKAATEILGYPGRMAIKERSGAKRSRAWGPGRYWVDISPADYEWTDNSVSMLSHIPHTHRRLTVMNRR